jgi:lipoprotein-releasing system permease protein
LQIFYPKNLKPGLTDPSQLANRKIIMPSAIFAIERQYDSYVFVPIDFAAELMDYGNRRTSIEIKPKEGYNQNQLKEELQEWIGSYYNVLDSDEQHSSLLKAIKIEKLFVFIALSCILAVASFNIFFSLTMLAIDKKKDISILLSMGASRTMVHKIFLFEGAIISLGGAIIGLLGGLLFCFLQSYFGIISMGMESSILDAYPVKMVFSDFLFTSLSIIIITLLASFHPARLAAKTQIRENL